MFFVLGELKFLWISMFVAPLTITGITFYVDVLNKQLQVNGTVRPRVI